MTPEQEQQRGVLAAQVMDNPVYREAFILMRAELMEKNSKTKFNQSAERDEIWRKMQTIEKMEAYFKKVMVTGKLGRSSIMERRRLQAIK